MAGSRKLKFQEGFFFFVVVVVFQLGNEDLWQHKFLVSKGSVFTQFRFWDVLWGLNKGLGTAAVQLSRQLNSRLLLEYFLPASCRFPYEICFVRFIQAYSNGPSLVLYNLIIIYATPLTQRISGAPVAYVYCVIHEFTSASPCGTVPHPQFIGTSQLF